MIATQALKGVPDMPLNSSVRLDKKNQRTLARIAASAAIVAWVLAVSPYARTLPRQTDHALEVSQRGVFSLRCRCLTSSVDNTARRASPASRPSDY